MMVKKDKADKAKRPLHKGGMPPFVPTDEERALVKLLIANGYAQHVCRYISKPPYLRRIMHSRRHRPPGRLIGLAPNLRRLVVVPS
jgi:hypothetical protein